MTVTHLTGDVLDQLATIPDGSVDLVATSPPFLALRNYNGLAGQWGSEPDPASFIDHLLELTTELRRVLALHGSIAIELGDKLNTGEYSAPLTKSLCGTPTLYAWSLAYGRNLLRPEHTIEPWRVRNVIVWARNNPPVGALGDKVRPAVSYITVACPSDKRWFDLDAVRDGQAGPRRERSADPKAARGQASGVNQFAVNRTWEATGGAPPLDHWHDEIEPDLLWLINTQGSSLAHYAMWPPKLVERLVLSMCPAEVCRDCGTPRRRLVGYTEQHAAHRQRSSEAGTDMRAERVRLGMAHGGRGSERMNAEHVTLGWSDCGHDDYRPGHVLDCFAGSGTTLAVADILGRDATGIDLDPANADLYPARYAQCWSALRPDAGTSPVTPEGQQLGLAL